MDQNFVFTSASKLYPKSFFTRMFATITKKIEIKITGRLVISGYAIEKAKIIAPMKIIKISLICSFVSIAFSEQAFL